MKSAIPSDLLKLKKRFEAWRKTRAKRSKTPDRLLKAAAALLDRYSASMVCRVCGVNLRTLRRRSSSSASPRRSSVPAPDFFPLSLTLSQPEVSSSPRRIGLRTSISSGPVILGSIFSFVLAPLFLLHSKQELFHSPNRCVFSLKERDDHEQNVQQLLDQ